MKKLLLTITSLTIGSYLFAQATALHFDGVDDYVKITNHTDLSGPDKITLESWIYVDNFYSSPCGNCAPVIWHQGSSYRFGTGNGKGLHFELSGPSGTQSINITKSVLKDSFWHHIAASFDGIWMRMYLDGKILDSLRTNFTSINYTSSNADIWIGDPATGYGGVLEETRIWNYARSLKEIREGSITKYKKSTKGLLLQLSYEDGVAYKDNSLVTDVADESSKGNDGILDYFALKDSTSNFILGLSYCDTVAYGSATVKACEKYRLPSGNRTVYKSGTYYDTIRSYRGCDSVITLKVNMNFGTTGKLKVVTCDSFKSISNKTLVYRKSGLYQERLVNSVGCDSLLNIDLTITNPSTTTFTYKRCGSVTLSGTGKIITKSGIYMDTFTGWGGCDSIIVHDVKILKNSTASVNLGFCSFVVCPTDRNVVYKKTGVYYDTIMNTGGCDSIITYNVISAKTTGEVDRTACNTFKMPGSGKVVTESGTYRDTLYGANSKACDSFVVINLTIIKPKTESTNVSACESYTSPGGKRVTATGKIYETYKSRLGCDSIIQTINVTIVNVDTKVNRDWNTLISASKGVSGSTFQWLDCKQNMQIIDGQTSAEFTTTGTGQYAVEVTQGTCVDTSICVFFAYTGTEAFGDFPMKIYPNPNAGSFKIDVGQTLNQAEVHIYDLTGKRVWKQSYATLQAEILHVNLGSGVYKIQVFGADKTFYSSLVVQ